MRRLTPIICVVALVLLGGCGSSSGDSSSASDGTSGGGSLSKAEFLAKADALCEASKAKQEPLRKKLEEVAEKARGEERSSEGLSDGTRQELARTLGRIVAMAEASQSQVQALGRPEGDAGQLEAIFAKTEAAFEASLAYGDAVERHEDAKAQAIAEKANSETQETALLATRYGFKVCGSQP